MDTRILLDQICEIVKEAGELIRGCSSVGERTGSGLCGGGGWIFSGENCGGQYVYY